MRLFGIGLWLEVRASQVQKLRGRINIGLMKILWPVEPLCRSEISAHQHETNLADRCAQFCNLVNQGRG